MPTEVSRARTEELAWRRLQTDAMLTFSRVHQQILRRSTERLDGAGMSALTPARANALIVLFNARGPINAQQLAADLGITAATVSRLIRPMEEDGWIERTPDPQDGRAMLLQLTPKTRAMFAPLVAVSNLLLDDIFGGLERQELQTLVELVGRVQSRLHDAVDASSR